MMSGQHMHAMIRMAACTEASTCSAGAQGQVAGRRDAQAGTQADGQIGDAGMPLSSLQLILRQRPLPVNGTVPQASSAAWLRAGAARHLPAHLHCVTSRWLHGAYRLC